MNYKHRINEMRGRAGKIGLPWGDLCREAGVEVSTIYRWLNEDDANPRLRSLMETLGRLQEVLERHEDEQRNYLLKLKEKTHGEN